MPDDRSGVSFVVPVRNGAQWLEMCLEAILAQERLEGEPLEVIAIDDGSTDESPSILARFARERGVVVLEGGGRGAAAAINAGVAAARFPVICQVDQDVVPDRGWMQHLVSVLRADPAAAAVQGEYRAAPDASLWARVTDLDLRLRWRRLHRGEGEAVEVDHVCTGNTAYRTGALLEIGGFDEALGYGYDNDVSYRLGRAGHRLVLCPSARATHHWRESAAGYLRQQYGQGYGRLDVVARHPSRASGDDVSGILMAAHAPAMLAAVAMLAGALIAWRMGGPASVLVAAAVAVIGVLALERFVAGVVAASVFHDRAGFAFAPVHLLRDVAWAWAIVTWGWRRLTRRAGSPGHSMGDLR